MQGKYTWKIDGMENGEQNDVMMMEIGKCNGVGRLEMPEEKQRVEEEDRERDEVKDMEQRKIDDKEKQSD